MRSGLLRRIAVVAAISVVSLLSVVPAASAEPIALGPCPIGYYGVQVIVQTPAGDRTVYACVQP